MNNMSAMNAANMGPMTGGPVGGGPMPIMNGGVVPPQAVQRQAQDLDHRARLNTYIYEYFIRNDMIDCARAILNSDQPINVILKDPKNGNVNGLGDDPMDTDQKDGMDSKRPDDLPAPNIPVPLPDSSFLYDWFCLFWDMFMFNAQRGKGAGTQVGQYVNHTQQQSRLKQSQQQQEMLRQMRPDQQLQMRPDQIQMMKNIGNTAMLKTNHLARTAMANNQNPNIMMMKQNHMQRDPSNMDGNQQRPASPGSSENAPSPSKRPRLEGPTHFNPNQQAMMRNGPQAPGQQPVGTGPGGGIAQAQQLLLSSGIDPSALTEQQLSNFAEQPPNVQAKSVATYQQSLQQHHGAQMPNKQMPNPNGPQGHGSPMADPAQLNAFYNGNMAAEGMRAGGAPSSGSNHALQDYQMQLMLLEQQNKKRLLMARQEQSDITNSMPRNDGAPGPGGQGGPGGPGGPGPNAPPGVAHPGHNGQGFQESPQGGRAGASPNPTDMKRGTPQMNNASIPSPLPEGAQSRGSPNAMNFMGNQMDPNMAPHFFNGMEPNRVANAQINGAMRPPSSHPGQPNFNGQPMNPQHQQQMMAAQQRQQQQQQGPGQPGAQQGPNGMQWQQGGPNGNPAMAQGPQGPQGPQAVQNTPQQRAMPPPSAPPVGNSNANGRNTTASPQQNTPAPPTPQAANKPAPKKKDSKSAKDKKRAAAQKKSATNHNAPAPAVDNTQEAEPPTPATPITPANANFAAKANQSAPGPQPMPNGQVSAAPAPSAAQVAQVAPPPPQDPAQNAFLADNPMDFNLDFANPMTTDNVLNDFDFDSFLHDDGGATNDFEFNTTFGMDGEGISAE